MTQTAFGLVGGVQKGAQISYEGDRRAPDATYLVAVEALGVDVLYVLTGRHEATGHPVSPTAAEGPPPTLTKRGPKWGVGAPVRSDTTQVGAPPIGGFELGAGGVLLASADVSVDRPLTLPVLFSAGDKIREYQVIPKFRADASAGKAGARAVGDDGFTTDVAGVLAVECDYMRRALGRDGAGFVTVTVSGDSMEPTLGDGDVIIVDTARTAIDASGIYVVELAGDMLVKRVQRRMDGSLVLKSDNPAYDPEHIQAGAAHTLRVMGRMTRLRFR